MLNRLLSTVRRGTSSTRHGAARTGAGRGGVAPAGRLSRRRTAQPTTGGTLGNMVRGLTRRR